jgi:hypothetical protein
MGWDGDGLEGSIEGFGRTAVIEDRKKMSATAPEERVQNYELESLRN